jgi:hypothetical protein
MLGFEIEDLQIIWVYQFISNNDESDKIIKIVSCPHMDKTFVGIVNEKYTYLLDELNMFLDKHCGDAVEKYIYLEDI